MICIYEITNEDSRTLHQHRTHTPDTCSTSLRGRRWGVLDLDLGPTSPHLAQLVQWQAQRHAQIARRRAKVRGGGGGAHPSSAAAVEGEVARAEAEGDVDLG
jgi:hypothetical protein